MQQPNPPKQSEHNKWLWAIIAAVILHVSVISVFLFNRSTTQNTSNSQTSSDISNDNPLSAPIETYTDYEQFEQIPTITESSSQDMQNKSDDKSNGQNSEQTVTDTSHATSSDALTNITAISQNEDEDADYDLPSQETSIQSKVSPKKDAINIPANHSPASGKDDATDANNGANQNGSGNTATTATPSIKPTHVPAYERILLPREIAGASQINTDDTEYNQVAKEVEQINEQLSATITEIKNEKKQQIQALRAQEQQAYQQRQKNQARQKQNNQKMAKINQQVSQQLDIDALAEAEFSVVTGAGAAESVVSIESIEPAHQENDTEAINQ